MLVNPTLYACHFLANFLSFDVKVLDFDDSWAKNTVDSASVEAQAGFLKIYDLLLGVDYDRIYEDLEMLDGGLEDAKACRSVVYIVGNYK